MIVPSQDDDTSGTDSESETEIDKGKKQDEDQGKKSVGDVHKSGSSSTSKGKQNVPQQPLASLTKDVDHRISLVSNCQKRIDRLDFELCLSRKIRNSRLD